MGLKKGYRNYDYNYIREYDSERFDSGYLIFFYISVYEFIYILIRFTFVITIVYIFVINRIDISILK